MSKKNPSEDIRDALEGSASRLRAIFETAVDGIITIDGRGVIQQINPAVRRLFEYKDKELIGENVRILMPEPDRSNHDGYLENYHQTGRRQIIGIGRQVMGRKKDGTTFPFRLSISEFVVSGQRMYTGIIHDLTEEVRAREKLRQLNESLEEKVAERTIELERMLSKVEETNATLTGEVSTRKAIEGKLKRALEKEKELNLLKSRFVSLASHEFRTPLNGIITSAALIEKYPKTEEVEKRQRHLERIKWSVGHLTNILEEFLSVEHIRSGKVAATPEKFKIGDLVGEIKDQIADILVEGKFLTHIETGEDREVFQDPDLIRNVVMNLLSNAFKYAGDDLEIEVRTHIENGMLRIEVADDGIGIPKADQKHLFERFFRARNTDGTRGTGLGLDIVKHFVHILQGEISFTSKEGVGTTFTVIIPTELDEEAKEPPLPVEDEEE